ncbi:uncharacterized protein LY79DRAFT_537868, partial [Colletotrichum navitas]
MFNGRQKERGRERRSKQSGAAFLPHSVPSQPWPWLGGWWAVTWCIRLLGVCSVVIDERTCGSTSGHYV